VLTCWLGARTRATSTFLATRAASWVYLREAATMSCWNDVLLGSIGAKYNGLYGDAGEMIQWSAGGKDLLVGGTNAQVRSHEHLCSSAKSGD
jgi:hypothetical protein